MFTELFSSILGPHIHHLADSPRAPRPSAASHRERCAPRAGTRLRHCGMRCALEDFFHIGWLNPHRAAAALVVQKWDMSRPKTWLVQWWSDLTFPYISCCDMDRLDRFKQISRKWHFRRPIPLNILRVFPRQSCVLAWNRSYMGTTRGH